MQALYKSPDGQWHNVIVIEHNKKMSLITYIDNVKRGITYHNGRKYNHGKTIKVWVYNNQLTYNH